jgi:hypothetical protein
LAKTNRSIVRNQAYQKSAFAIRERHNERQNESYYNADIEAGRQHLNVYFKRSEGSYSEAFEAMLASGAISTRGQKAGAKVFDELIFDVNSAYFKHNGGYEYAKAFFEEAYRYAIKEIGGEEYVLSAVMHADERNKALSEEMGRDAYHYHLHVVYVPVVDKEILWSKRCKDPSLVGTVKETIKQVSHSKKWPRYKTENGWVNSYSLLQDRFHDHMKTAGYDGFERGERGSTTEHLSVLEYKSKQEAERAAAMTTVVEKKQQAAADLDTEINDKEEAIAALDEQAGKKTKRNERLDEQIAVKDKAKATIAEIDAMGKPALLGGVNVSNDEIGRLKTLAKKSVTIEDKTKNLNQQLKAANNELTLVKAELAAEFKKRPSIKDHLSWWDKFMSAMRRAPKRLMAVIDEILREPPERNEPERTAPELKKVKSHER